MLKPKPHQQHPYGTILPAMPEADFAALVEDIGKNGLREPVVMYQGKILDGWHRYNACQDSFTEPAFRDFHGTDAEAIAFVLSTNLHRRHLTPSQRAAAVVKAAEMAPKGRPEKGAPGAPLKATIEQAAKAADVSTRTIKHAKAAQAAGLGEAVLTGKISAKEGAAIAKLPEPERAAAVEAGHAPKQEAPEDEYTDEEAEADAKADALAALEEMQRVFDADDKLKAAMAEVQRLKTLERVLQTRIDEKATTAVALEKDGGRWMRKAQRYEKAAKACTCGAMKECK